MVISQALGSYKPVALLIRKIQGEKEAQLLGSREQTEGKIEVKAQLDINSS